MAPSGKAGSSPTIAPTHGLQLPSASCPRANTVFSTRSISMLSGRPEDALVISVRIVSPAGPVSTISVNSPGSKIGGPISMDTRVAFPATLWRASSNRLALKPTAWARPSEASVGAAGEGRGVGAGVAVSRGVAVGVAVGVVAAVGVGVAAAGVSGRGVGESAASTVGAGVTAPGGGASSPQAVATRMATVPSARVIMPAARRARRADAPRTDASCAGRGLAAQSIKPDRRANVTSRA